MKEIWDTRTNEELCLEYQETKSNKLFEYFLSRNIALIMNYIQPILRKHFDQKEELVETCRVAMWEAMCKYSPDKECKFSTYVYYFFKKNVWHHWHSQLSVTTSINAMNKLQEIRERCPYIIFDTISLSTPKGCRPEEVNNPDTIEDLIPSDDPTPEEVLVQQDNLDYLIRLGKKVLSPRTLNCLMLYYGLDGNGPRTLQQIGDMYHVTRERIRQVLEKGLRKLKIHYLKERQEDEE